MTPERDQQISALFHAAGELPDAERAAFLTRACAGDEALRGEVEALLAGDARAGDFLRGPLRAVDDAFAELFAASATSSGIASLPETPLLGRYQVISLLGAGGMGKVFLAQDTQLDRRVAIKLLPAEFIADAERLRRFTREAKAVSALNHPNIVTIHEIGQTQTDRGVLHFIVTEYVDGQTLRAHLTQGPLPLDAALDIALQTTGALAAAHEAGVIHRDIKPENLMVRRDGYVKLLDFGLAKFTELRTADGGRRTEAPAHLSRDDVNNPPSTTPGLMMGTAQYMSPEQARGQVVDARTDLFSLGVVLYEMVTGRAPFSGVNAVDVMGAILNLEPAPLRLPTAYAAPQVADWKATIIAKALRKDRAERYQSAGELLLDLKKLKHDSASQTAVTAARRTSGRHATDERRDLARLVAPLLAVAVAVSALAYYALNRAPERSNGPLHFVPFSSLPGTEADPAFSPDGNQLAYTWDGGAGGQTDIYVKLIGAGEPLRLTSDPADDVNPTWSPDGRYVAFIRRSSTENQALIVPALGGTERKLCAGNHEMAYPNWSPDGKWLALTDVLGGRGGTRIVLVSLETGEKHPLATPPPGFVDLLPVFSPDGAQLAFVRESPGTGADLFVTTPHFGPERRERRLTIGSRRIYGLTWAADGGEIVYDSDRVGSRMLWRIPVDGGDPQALFSGGASYSLPSVARKGDRLAFVEKYTNSNIRLASLPELNLTQKPAASARRPIEFRWDAMKELIASKRQNDSAQFSPDGKKIAFASDRAGSMEIWVGGRDGGNTAQLTRTAGAFAGSPRWSPDGRFLAYDARPEVQSDILVMSVEGGTPRRLTHQFRNILPSWSRDGAWIYFCSRRTGEDQLWKVPAAGGEAVQITKRGGFDAVESPDGKTIYYSKGSLVNGLWTVPSAGGEERPIPELADAGYWRAWSVTNDGIYFIANVGSAAPRPLKFFSFATGRVLPVGTVDRDPPRYGASLAISPDGRQMLYTQIEQNRSNIMIVENFR